MRHTTSFFLLLTAVIALAVIGLPDDTATAAARGFGGIVQVPERCQADGVKDTQIDVYNPATTAVTITVKVVSTGGVGSPMDYTLPPMGLRRFDCKAAASLYGGAVKRAVLVIQSDSDVRVGGMYIAKFKSLPVPLAAGPQLSPVGQ